MPTFGGTADAAWMPWQSQETDMLRSTFTNVIARPSEEKKSTVAFADSLIRSMSSSSAISHMLEEPGVVWICALPRRPSAHPMPMFLFEPPKPSITWPLKW